MVAGCTSCSRSRAERFQQLEAFSENSRPSSLTGAFMCCGAVQVPEQAKRKYKVRSLFSENHCRHGSVQGDDLDPRRTWYPYLIFNGARCDIRENQSRLKLIAPKGARKVVELVLYVRPASEIHYHGTGA